MKYYGDVNKNRLEEIDYWHLKDIKNPTSPIGFIYESGSFFDYVIKKFEIDGPAISNLYKPGEEPRRVTNVSYRDCRGYQKKKYKGNVYYVGVIKADDKDPLLMAWRLRPRIENDDIFKWKDNPKYNSKETVIRQDNFEFKCIVRADGDAVIDAKYAKCDNQHRNKVTISRIEVFNASNEELLDAINAWIKEFKKEMTETNDNIYKLRRIA